jgi:hypothetical protein
MVMMMHHRQVAGRRAALCVSHAAAGGAGSCRSAAGAGSCRSVVSGRACKAYCVGGANGYPGKPCGAAGGLAACMLHSSAGRCCPCACAAARMRTVTCSRAHVWCMQDPCSRPDSARLAVVMVLKRLTRAPSHTHTLTNRHLSTDAVCLGTLTDGHPMTPRDCGCA